MSDRVIVVGAGVVGLTCAIRLAEAGYDVHVLARDLPLETTSAVAAALWYPYRALPHAQVADWAATSYDVFRDLAEREPAAGVDLVPGVELLRQPAGDPWWRAAVPTLAHAGADRLPAGYADGWELRLPVADPGVYLPWLVTRLEELGGTVTRRWLDALPDGRVVVNCSGLAARRLADDGGVRPVQGQVVLLERTATGPGAVDHWLLDHSDPDRLVYVVPRRSQVVVGGTAVEGAWGRDPDPQLAAELLRRATELEPRIRGARVIGHRVGLRPARATVRLQTEQRTQQHGGASRVVHCYGHGGAGVTLSWGCAADVVREVAGLAS